MPSFIQSADENKNVKTMWVNAEMKARAKAEAKAVMKAKAESNAVMKAKAEAKAVMKANMKAKAEAKAVMKAKAESKTDMSAGRIKRGATNLANRRAHKPNAPHHAADGTLYDPKLHFHGYETDNGYVWSGKRWT